MNELQPNNPEMGVKDFFAVLRRRAWLILPVMLLCLGGAYYWYLHTPKLYRAESQLMLIQRPAMSGGNSVDGTVPQPIESMETQVALIQSNAMGSRTMSWLKNFNLAYNLATDTTALSQAKIQGAIKVTNPTDSDLLIVTADANSALQAKNLANAVARAFVQYKRDLATNDLVGTENNLKHRVALSRAKMEAAEEAETKFKTANNLSNVDAKEKAANDQFYSADQQVAALTEKLANQSARVQVLDAQLQAADAALQSEGGVPDEAGVQALQTELDHLKAQRAETAREYTPDFPGSPGTPSIATLDNEIKDKQQQFDRAKRASTSNAAPSLMARSGLLQADQDAHAQEVATQGELAAAVASRQAYQQQIVKMPNLQEQYIRLSQNTEIATAIYKNLQAALSATLLQRDLVSGNVTITQYAEAPMAPYSPNLKTNIILGLALGALLSLGLVMLLEQLDQRVRTLDEVRALVSGPIIGMLPRTSRGQMKALEQGRLLPQFEEAFSLVGVNLSYIMRNSMMRDQVEHQIILVTSASPGEGKSVAAAELARSMAESGKTVILVNANLREPSKNVLFQTGEEGGLTDVLAGELPLDEAIATSNVANLSVLNSGLSYQNPTVLLSQPRLASVMEELRYKADVVILDGPDCTMAADTLLLTAHADCLMQVVRAGAIDMETLHNASLGLHSTGKKVTVLVNGLTRPQQRTFKTRFAYGALSSQSEAPALPQTFEKTMMMNRSRDLVFSKSSPKSLENPAGTPEKDEAS